MNSKDIWRDYQKFSNHKICFFRDKTNCSKKIKKAHSIQKQKVLTQLEGTINKNQLIYSLDSTESDENFNTIKLIPIGKKIASVFTGFCDYHDSILFSPIENFDFSFTDEQKFLMTYRSFAHSLQQLTQVYKFYQSESEFVKKFPDSWVKSHIKYTEKDLYDISKYKMILDNLIESKEYSKINYHIRAIEPFVPIASSSILSLNYSVKNVNLKNKKSFIVLNIFPDTNRTIILLSHFEQDINGKILFTEFQELSDSDFTKAISSILIYCTENTFFSPKLWEKFSQEKKNRLFKEIDFCIKYGGQLNKFFLSEIDFFKL